MTQIRLCDGPNCPNPPETMFMPSFIGWRLQQNMMPSVGMTPLAEKDFCCLKCLLECVTNLMFPQDPDEDDKK